MASYLSSASTSTAVIPSHRRSRELQLLSLPIELIHEIFSHLSLNDLVRLQLTCNSLYNLILSDRAYTYYNTVKFFELYYSKQVLAIYLFAYIHPCYSYYGLEKRGRPHSTPLPNGDDLAAGNTGFHIAAANGLKDVIDAYLQRERQDRLHFRPLNLRARFNQEAAEIIHLKPTNQDCRLVDLENDEPNTALHYISIIPEAINEDDVLSVARLLFRSGESDFRRKGRAGNTVLCEAAQHGQAKMVKLIVEEVKRSLLQDALKAGAVLESPLSGRDRSAPTHLQQNSSLALPLRQVRRQVRSSVNGQLASVPFTDASHYNAIESQVHQQVVDYINTSNDYAENAVILAARSSPAILHHLLEEGGDPNSHRHSSPLIHIVCSLFSLDRQDPASFQQYHDERSQNGGQPYHERNFYLSSYRNGTADEMGDNKNYDLVLKSLLQFGADPHVVHEDTGMKPAHTAAFWGNTGALEILIKDASIDPNREVNLRNNWLPIHYACDEGQLWVIYTLIGHGAHIVYPEEDEVQDMQVDGGSEILQHSRSAEEDTINRAIRHAPNPIDLLRIDAMKVKVLLLARSTQQFRRSRTL